MYKKWNKETNNDLLFGSLSNPNNINSYIYRKDFYFINGMNSNTNDILKNTIIKYSLNNKNNKYEISHNKFDIPNINNQFSTYILQTKIVNYFFYSENSILYIYKIKKNQLILELEIKIDGQKPPIHLQAVCFNKNIILLFFILNRKNNIMLINLKTKKSEYLDFPDVFPNDLYGYTITSAKKKIVLYGGFSEKTKDLNKKIYIFRLLNKKLEILKEFSYNEFNPTTFSFIKLIGKKLYILGGTETGYESRSLIYITKFIKKENKVIVEKKIDYPQKCMYNIAFHNKKFYLLNGWNYNPESKKYICEDPNIYEFN